ncbi:MAG: carbonic anhydrase [Halioglobus sp.]
MDKIIEGVLNFQKNVFPSHQALFDELASQQNPDVLFITCSDSRIDPNLVTQSKPGDLFICRNAGNIVPPHSRATGGMTASIEYAVAVLNVRHIIICGHTDCGAMKGVLNMEALENLPHVKEWLGHSRSALEVVKAQTKSTVVGLEQLQRVTEENVLQQLQNLKTHPVVAAKLATGDLQLHGWMYEIESGEVCCSGDNREFNALSESR